MTWAGGAAQGGGSGMAGNIKSTLYGPAAPGYGSSSTWHPTVAWMLGFTVAEILLYNILSHYLNI